MQSKKLVLKALLPIKQVPSPHRFHNGPECSRAAQVPSTNHDAFVEAVAY
jgi:hypothetical protein